MKIFLCLLLLIGMTSMGKAQEFKFRLKGDFINVDTATVALYTLDEAPRLLASAKMENGKFILKGTLPESGYYRIQIGAVKQNIILDAPDMFWPTDYLNADARYIKNSPAVWTELDIHRLIREQFEQPVCTLKKEYAAKRGKDGLLSPELDREWKEQQQRYLVRLQELLLDYTREHSDALFMPIFIRQYISQFGYEWGKNAYKTLNSEIQSSQPGRLLQAHLEKLSHTVNGTPFPATTLQNTKGENVNLKFDDGKVYVIDFWASWCGPCRVMMQALKGIHKEYAGQPVEFISISLEEKEKNWLVADREEQIPWESYRSEKAFNSNIAKHLGIEAIPFIVLIDKQGKIAAKNPRDEELIDKINELLK